MVEGDLQVEIQDGYHYEVTKAECDKWSIIWIDTDQDAPFFYTSSHLSELQSFKSIILK